MISDLQELLEKAGPLPWKFVPNQESQPDWGGDIHAADGLYVAHDHEGLHGAVETPDAALIVAAINALPALLRLIEGTDPASPQPDEHPEARCQRCGRPNIVWFVASDLWNAVMRPVLSEGGARWGIVCPVCFAQLAEECGVVPTAWQLAPEQAPGAPVVEQARRA